MVVEYENTKVKGDYAELEIGLLLKRRGYVVAIPYGENQPYDLVVESPARRLYRIQVRWVAWEEDALEIPLRITSKNYSRTIDLTRIDIFAVWDGAKAYFIPTADMADCKATFTLRKSTPKNGQKKGVRFASSYETLKHLE